MHKNMWIFCQGLRIPYKSISHRKFPQFPAYSHCLSCSHQRAMGALGTSLGCGWVSASPWPSLGCRGTAASPWSHLGLQGDLSSGTLDLLPLLSAGSDTIVLITTVTPLSHCLFYCVGFPPPSQIYCLRAAIPDWLSLGAAWCWLCHIWGKKFLAAPHSSHICSTPGHQNLAMLTQHICLALA